MRRTTYTSPGLATYQGADRRTYLPEWIVANDHSWLLVQLCEDYVEDQWEPTVLNLWRLESKSLN